MPFATYIIICISMLRYTTYIVLSLVVVSLSCDVNGCTIQLESEHGTSTGMEMYRSDASNGITVSLKEDDSISHTFITYSDCVLMVENVAYSNDGTQDELRVLIDTTTVIGSFQTISLTGNGDLWNEIQNSGPVGNETHISAGDHKLTLVAISTDLHGVELDTVTLAFMCATDISALEVCSKSEVESTDTDSQGDDSSGGDGLSTAAIISIVLTVAGLVIGIPGCIVATLAIMKCINSEDRSTL